MYRGKVSDCRCSDKATVTLTLESNIKAENTVDFELSGAINSAVSGFLRDLNLRKTTFSQHPLGKPFKSIGVHILKNISKLFSPGLQFVGILCVIVGWIIVFRFIR